MVGPRRPLQRRPDLSRARRALASSEASGAHIGTPRTGRGRLVKPTQVGALASAPVTWSTRALRVHWEITGFDALAPLAPETGKGGGRAAAVPRWQRPGGERTYGGAW